MFVRTGLTALATGPVTPAVFGRFEADRPNEIWTGDALWRIRHKASPIQPSVSAEGSPPMHLDSDPALTIVRPHFSFGGRRLRWLSG